MGRIGIQYSGAHLSSLFAVKAGSNHSHTDLNRLKFCDHSLVFERCKEVETGASPVSMLRDTERYVE